MSWARRSRSTEPILEQLEQAWNAGDGMGFAGPYAEDADFVEIRAGTTTLVTSER